MSRAALSALALVSSACTFEDGTGFATLERAELRLEIVPGEARDLGMRTILSDQGYAVRLATAELVIGDIALEETTSSGAAGGSFDPQNPPPGYGACHGGHCHADDGRLVPYEQIEAELGGGGSTIVRVASLPVHTPLDMWSDAPVSLSRVEPSRELPRAELSRLSAEAELLEISGDVREEPPTGAAPVPLTVRLPIGASLSAPLELAIDRDEPGEFSLAVRITPSARLVDGIDYLALVSGGQILLDDPESAAAQIMIQALLGSPVTVDIE